MLWEPSKGLKQRDWHIERLPYFRHTMTFVCNTTIQSLLRRLYVDPYSARQGRPPYLFIHP